MKKLLVAVTTVCMLIGSAGMAAVQKGAVADSHMAGSSVSGSVQVQDREGRQQALAGVTVFVCSRGLSDEISKVRATGRLMAQAQKIDDYRALIKDFVYMLGRVEARAVAHAQTGPDGRFSLPEVPAGDYVLYVAHRDDTRAIYWIVPVVVKPGGAAAIVLSGENAVETAYRSTQ